MSAPCSRNISPAICEARDGRSSRRKYPERTEFEAALKRALGDAGYPEQADPARIDHITVVALLFLLVLYVTMVYGPIAATPFFQGDSRILGALRDHLMPLVARMPVLRPLMVATMCGVRQGFLRRSLRLPAHSLR